MVDGSFRVVYQIGSPVSFARSRLGSPSLHGECTERRPRHGVPSVTHDESSCELGPARRGGSCDCNGYHTCHARRERRGAQTASVAVGRSNSGGGAIGVATNGRSCLDRRTLTTAVAGRERGMGYRLQPRSTVERGRTAMLRVRYTLVSAMT